VLHNKAVGKADDMECRASTFAAETVKFCESIPVSTEAQRIKAQLSAAATPVGANFRAARRSRSHAEFTAKIGVVSEEADECEYWFELIRKLELGEPTKRAELHQEAIELMRIFGKASATARRNRPNHISRPSKSPNPKSPNS
jgi:four helix bundle protein